MEWIKNLVCDGGLVGKVDRFSNNLRQIVGNGRETSFSCDPWFEGGLLCDRFSRLFEVAIDKKNYSSRYECSRVEGWWGRMTVEKKFVYLGG